MKTHDDGLSKIRYKVVIYIIPGSSFLFYLNVRYMRFRINIFLYLIKLQVRGNKLFKKFNKLIFLRIFKMRKCSDLKI